MMAISRGGEREKAQFERDSPAFFEIPCICVSVAFSVQTETKKPKKKNEDHLFLLSL